MLARHDGGILLNSNHVRDVLMFEESVSGKGVIRLEA